jgi:DNA polymerase alpha subunit A
MVNVQAENDKAKRANGGDPIVTQTSERALLSYLLTRLHLLDPDVIVGHNIGNWDLNILLVRMQLFKVVHWSRVGRIKRQRMPNLTGGGNMYGGGASQV